MQLKTYRFEKGKLEVGVSVNISLSGPYNQVMPVSEKSLVLSLQKIYNWGEGDSKDAYEFSFHSRGASSSLLHTHIKTQIINRHLMINSSLRVTYTPQENQIMVRMSRISNKNIPHVIAEFVINLDQLADQKVQYFSFDKNDKVLKVTAGAPFNPSKKNPAIAIDRSTHQLNENFIRERQNFLKRINLNTPSMTGSKSFLPEKTFVEKLHSLLREARRLRTQNTADQTQYYRDYSEHNFYSYYEDPVTETYEPEHVFLEKGERQLLKSRSEQLFKVSSEVKTKPREGQPIKQAGFDRPSLHFQRHRLQLKDLRMVPLLSYDHNNEDVLRSETEYLTINANSLSHNIPVPKRGKF